MFPELNLFYLKKIIILLAGLVLNFSILAQTSSLQPDNLRCEYIENPLGIDTKHPRLSWEFLAGDRNQFQSAYELIVSTNSADIENMKGNVWSTGKVISSQNLHIE